MTIFICYDTNQRNYFRRKGFKDVIKGLHPKTLSPFWIFERNKNFDNCLKDWLAQKS